MTPRLPQLSSREVIRLLESRGFSLERQSGSHAAIATAGSQSKTWRIVGIVLLIVAAGFGAGVGFLLYRDYRISPQRWPRVEFTSSEWKALAPEKRFALVNDLIERDRRASLYLLHIRFDGEGRVEEYYVRYD